jgi:hypothetical protein
MMPGKGRSKVDTDGLFGAQVIVGDNKNPPSLPARGRPVK